MKDLLMIGADPEVFVTKGNKFVPAFNMIPGTKWEPYPVPNGAVQVDGLALEFNIDPAGDCNTFTENIMNVYNTLSSMIPEDMQLEISPTAMFDDETMASLPREAKELGCNPDYNAYTGETNPSPHAHPNMRTAAGHIHLGWTNTDDPYGNAHMATCMLLVKQLDIKLGIPSVLLDPDNKRREMYGKAGAFRPKPYGLEYRVLSNFWLKSPELMEWVYNTTSLTFKNFISGIVFKDPVGFYPRNPGRMMSFNSWKEVVERCINNNDTGLSKDIAYNFSRMPVSYTW